MVYFVSLFKLIISTHTHTHTHTHTQKLRNHMIRVLKSTQISPFRVEIDEHVPGSSLVSTPLNISNVICVYLQWVSVFGCVVSICSECLYLVVLWVFAAHEWSNWLRRFLNLLVFFICSVLRYLGHHIKGPKMKLYLLYTENSQA